MNIQQALVALRPGAKWVMRGDQSDLANLEWLDDQQSRPTDDEIIAKCAEAAPVEAPVDKLRAFLAANPDVASIL